MLNSVPLFVRAVSKGNELYRIQTKSLSTLLKSPLTGETKSIWSGSRTIFDLTMSSLLAWGFHKLMMHFGMDTEGFKVWTWSSDEREMDFSLISCLWSNNVFKNDNLGLASLTNPLPLPALSFYQTMTVKPMRDWNTPGAGCVLSVCQECRIDVWTMQIF